MKRKKLKVFGGSPDGVYRVIMATTSRESFVRATTCPRNDVCETGSLIECGVALNEPEVLFAKKDDLRDGGFGRLGPPPFRWASLLVLDQEERNA